MAAPAGAVPADGEPRTVVLVRPGAAPADAEGGSSSGGVFGPTLTARGRTQAARAADAVFRLGKDLWPHLPPATGGLVAPPLLRAVETAAAVGRRIGRPVATDERFAAGGADDGAPDDGAYGEVGERSWAGLSDLVAGARAGSTTVVVAPAATIRTLAGRALAAPPSSWPLLHLPPGSLTILRLGPGDGGPVTREVTTLGFPTDR